MATNKDNVIYDENGEEITRQQITDAYHSGVVDSWIEQKVASERLSKQENKASDPKE